MPPLGLIAHVQSDVGIVSLSMKTVSAAQKTVISPTEVRNITKEILADFDSGSVDKFERALSRSEKI